MTACFLQNEPPSSMYVALSLSPIPDGGIAKASMNNAYIITSVMMSVACTRPETR